jgi:hypothetical protein
MKQVASIGKLIWKHFFLVFLIGLALFHVFLLLSDNEFPEIAYPSFMIALGLLLSHIAYTYTKTGWQSKVMKTVAWIWLIVLLVYVIWTANA